MKKRNHLTTWQSWWWFTLLTSLLLAVGLFSGTTIGADSPSPTPTPVRGGPTPWITTTVRGLEAPVEMVKPAKGHLKLESSLHQLLEAYRLEGLAEAQAFAKTHMMALEDDRVQIVVAATTQEAMSDLREAVEALGGEYQTHYEMVLQALVPIDALESLAKRLDVQAIREPRRPIPVTPVRAGTVDTEGLGASNASAWHAAGYTGAGVRVAIIDGGFTDYASLLATDLPASVTTYDWTGTGMGSSPHGTACAEIVYDMAPGVTMDLHKIGTDVELGNAVNQAIADGVDIISMSLIWLLDGPGDGTGFLSDIVNNARSNGIFYAATAGNNAEHCWSGTYNDSGFDTHLWASGQDINYFGPGNGDAWIIPAGFPIEVALHWDDWTVVDQDYDMELYYWDGDAWQYVTGSYNDQAAGYPTPEESINVDASVEAPYGVVVRRTSSTRDVCLRLNASHQGADLDERVPERSLMFPADSPDAITVGAVDVSSPYPLEPYSSQGPTFGPGGTCYGGSTRPDIAAYANVSTVSYGVRNFAGTSAATPHVAGAAALVKQRYPSYTVSQLQSYLESNAIDLGSPGKDNFYGTGRLSLILIPYEGYLVLGGDDDYADTPDHQELDIGDEPGESLTIEAWMNIQTRGWYERLDIINKPVSYMLYAWTDWLYVDYHWRAYGCIGFELARPDGTWGGVHRLSLACLLARLAPRGWRVQPRDWGDEHLPRRHTVRRLLLRASCQEFYGSCKSRGKLHQCTGRSPHFRCGSLHWNFRSDCIPLYV